MQLNMADSQGGHQDGRKIPFLGAMRERLTWSVLFVAIIALAGWLARHPYSGIVHDGRLYALQAMSAINPEIYRNDLFLRFGSQDDYTVFSPIYAQFITWFGLDMATKVLLILGHLSWLGFAVLLVRQLVPGPMAGLAVVYLVSLSPDYGGFGIFSFGESFLSPRLFSEAFGLGALWAFILKRHIFAAGLLAVSAVMHPIMALGPFMIIFACLVLNQRIALVTLLGCISGILALLVARPALAIALLTQMDPEWMRVVEERTAGLFLSNWPVANWLKVSLDAAILLLAGLVSQGPQRRYFVVALACAVLCLLISFIGGDLLRSVLVIQVQPWRVLWVVHAFALMALAVIVLQLAETRFRNSWLLSRLSILLAVTVALSALVPFGYLTGNVIALALLAFVAIDRSTSGGIQFSKMANWILLGISALLCLLTLESVVWGMLNVRVIQGLTPADSDPLIRFVSFIPIVSVLLGTAAVLSSSEYWLKRMSVLGICLLAIALATWDRRNDWRQYIDSGPDILAQLPKTIPRHGSVYWDGEIMAVWAGLRRTSYFDKVQGAGIVFNRNTAIEYDRRAKVIEVINSATRINHSNESIVPMYQVIHKEDLAQICGNSAAPALVVLTQIVRDVPVQVWRSPRSFSQYFRKSSSALGDRNDIFVKSTREFYVYDCSSILPAVNELPSSAAHGSIF